ncbi:dipeptidase [Paenibacillus physcomitrellae]|uniref:Dipeptidase n=1 Tax=Paenibacillus physcomitrellae TaxID=1619311 RepID=A0ABQ1G944_9BACL|nr:membrane dipeptidase [Paenibacillus physcomitrellae]GGA39094.1 dipeptidase [Paenibacillus physcomitrellae]
MKWGIIDFHCDALSKLQENPEIRFEEDERLDVSAKKLSQGGVGLQCFAIFIDDEQEKARIGRVLEQISLYRTEVEKAGIPLVTSRQELAALNAAGGGTGGMLSLEGAHGLEGNLKYVQNCYDLGVRFLGITWNHANWAADGIMEPRGGGFTQKGHELVKLCHELGIILDVSHLSIKGFWELTEAAEKVGKPFIASHSNSIKICDHPRNLSDEQIRTIVRLGGRIGLTFVPPFVKASGPVKMTDLLPHLEHMCSLGAENHLMFGSDFDGIDEHIEGLEHAACYVSFKELLLKYYSEPLVDKWLSLNAMRFLQTWLPATKKAL